MGLKFLDPHVTERVSRKASAAIVAGTAVKTNTTDALKVDPCSTASTDPAIGIAENDVTAADITNGQDQVSIATAGRVKARAGGTIAVGNKVTMASDAELVAIGTTATVLYEVLGIALTGAADQEFFTLQLERFAMWGANAS